MGYNYYLLERYDQAVRAYENALELATQLLGVWTFVDIYYEMGRSYHELGNHDRELEAYEIGLLAVPENPGILHRLAICYLSRGDTARAALYLEQYKRKQDEEGLSQAEIFDVIGDIYWESDLLTQAIGSYRQAIEADQSFHWPYSSLGFILIDNDMDVAEGLRLIETALDLSPENPDHLHWKGWGLYKQGRYAEALELLERSWELRMYYNHDHYQHLQAARKAAAGGK